MASYNVHPQGVPRFARLDAVWALVEEALDVRLYVLLHSGPDLAGEVALGALPAGLARHSVVAGNHQLVPLDSIAISLFENITVETGEILIITQRVSEQKI